MFKDCKNNPLQVGDKVVFVANSKGSSCLKFGTITRIYKNEKACTVDSHSNVYPERILKYPED